MGRNTLRGTDYVLRACAFTVQDIRSIIKDCAPWIAPLFAFELWALLDPASPAGQLKAQTQAALQSGWAARMPLSFYVTLYAHALLTVAMIAGYAAMRHRQILHQSVQIDRTLKTALPIYVGYWLLTGLLATILIVISIFVMMMFLQLAGPVPAVVILILLEGLIGLAAVRTMLIFPAIAVGDRAMTIERSFLLTKASMWRIALSILGLSLLLGITLQLLLLAGEYLARLGSVSTSSIAIVLKLFIEFVLTATFVTYISLLYAHFTGGKVPMPEDWDKA
jgi:hypothetical protein